MYAPSPPTTYSMLDCNHQPVIKQIQRFGLPEVCFHLCNNEFVRQLSVSQNYLFSVKGMRLFKPINEPLILQLI